MPFESVSVSTGLFRHMTSYMFDSVLLFFDVLTIFKLFAYVFIFNCVFVTDVFATLGSLGRKGGI